LPAGTRQVSVSSHTRSDVLYEGYRLLVELDGHRGHASAGAAFRDLRRDNAHAESGFTSLRYGSADVYGRPCEVARQVWQVLQVRGWDRPLLSCPRCPRPSHR
jgi:very-short-patch-repair endonuclease